MAIDPSRCSSRLYPGRYRRVARHRCRTVSWSSFLGSLRIHVRIDSFAYFPWFVLTGQALRCCAAARDFRWGGERNPSLCKRLAAREGLCKLLVMRLQEEQASWKKPTSGDVTVQKVTEDSLSHASRKKAPLEPRHQLVLDLFPHP